MRFAPAACSRRLIAAPTRLAPPVMRTTLPCTSGAPGLDSGSNACRVGSRAGSRTLAQPSRVPRAFPDPIDVPADFLPEPDAAARAHGAAVAAALALEIDAAGGWLTLEAYLRF